MGDGTSTDIDGVAQAVGRVTEALETIERARGHLYSFHQLTGRADLQLDEAVARLMALKEPRHTAGHPAHTASPNDESAEGESL